MKLSKEREERDEKLPSKYRERMNKRNKGHNSSCFFFYNEMVVAVNKIRNVIHEKV